MEKLIVFLLFVFVAHAQENTFLETTVVTLSKGSLRGYIQQFLEPLSNTDVRLKVFKGVPFAEPPVRFKPPMEKLPWAEEYDATFYRYACPQPFLPLEFMSDNCLFMNIWAPENIPEGTSLPVMVVIHSGDFQTGSASSDLTSGAPMAAINNVIVVNFNYRLGVFGFATSDSDLVPGNVGLMDQAMAMRWVRENIAAFGGNSNQVTVVGDTSGAVSATLQIVSPKGREQFDQVIIQDGSFYTYWGFNGNRTLESEKSAELAYRMGCPSYKDDEEILECFSESTLQRIIQAVIPMNYEGKVFVPTVDGQFIPENPAQMISKGDFKRCPIIAGYSADAGTRDILFFKEDLNRQTPPRLTSDDLGAILYVSKSTISSDYTIQKTLQYTAAQQYLDFSKISRPNYDYFEPAVEMHGDVGYTCPVLNFTWSWHISSTPVYIYQMSFTPNISIYKALNISTATWLGATVEEIIQFSAGLGFVPELNAAGFNPPDQDKIFALAVMRYFSNFAKSGNPNTPNEVPLQWLNYTDQWQYTLNMDIMPELEDGEKANVCHLWNVLIPNLRYTLEKLSYKAKEASSEAGVLAEWNSEFRDWQKYNEEWKEVFKAYQEGTCN